MDGKCAYCKETQIYLLALFLILLLVEGQCDARCFVIGRKRDVASTGCRPAGRADVDTTYRTVSDVLLYHRTVHSFASDPKILIPSIDQFPHSSSCIICCATAGGKPIIISILFRFRDLRSANGKYDTVLFLLPAHHLLASS